MNKKIDVRLNLNQLKLLSRSLNSLRHSKTLQTRHEKDLDHIEQLIEENMAELEEYERDQELYEEDEDGFKKLKQG